MSLTFYILLGFLNLFKQRENFKSKTLEFKTNLYFMIYSLLWMFIIPIAIFSFFYSPVLYVFSAIILLWFILELFTTKAILIYGKNKDIMLNEFMDVNK